MIDGGDGQGHGGCDGQLDRVCDGQVDGGHVGRVDKGYDDQVVAVCSAGRMMSGGMCLGYLGLCVGLWE